jgi:ABC-2 type transport system permease protein
VTQSRSVSTEAPLVPPSSTTGLLEVFRRRYLLRLLVRREIQARYQGSFLGMIWSYINPLSQFFIYWFILGQIVGLANRDGMQNFAIHVFCGLIIVHFANETLNAGTRSIVRNGAVVQKMAVPREMFPVASMLVSAIHVGPQLVILVIACSLSGWSPDPVGMGAAALGLTIMAVLGTALALLFSVANVFLRDVSNGVQILTNFIRFAVPMIYPYTLVAERFGPYAQFYLWNPIADAVLLMQRAFWVGTTSDPVVFTEKHIPSDLYMMSGFALLASVILLVVAQLVFSRAESRIPEQL